ncbi:MAG: hypothetical protein Q8O88_04855 [bacterium]|nr:hypothetical protein [bacterium]
MKPIVAIRYRDALYYTRKEIKDFILPVYVAVGNLIVSKDYIIIYFTEEKNLPIRGILIPNEALSLEKKEKRVVVKIPNIINQTAREVGVFWKDIVYFENGKIPNKPTQMYTEGQFFLQTSDVIILKNPETLTIERGSMHNHPRVRPTFYTIPKVLITEIEFYDKKL